MALTEEVKNDKIEVLNLAAGIQWYRFALLLSSSVMTKKYHDHSTVMYLHLMRIYQAKTLTLWQLRTQYSQTKRRLLMLPLKKEKSNG